MLGTTDLMNSLEVEQFRRSIAMLKPGANALNREDTLQVLNALAALLKADDAARWIPSERSERRG